MNLGPLTARHSTMMFGFKEEEVEGIKEGKSGCTEVEDEEDDVADKYKGKEVEEKMSRKTRRPR